MYSTSNDSPTAVRNKKWSICAVFSLLILKYREWETCVSRVHQLLLSAYLIVRQGEKRQRDMRDNRLENLLVQDRNLAQEESMFKHGR